MSDQNPAPTTNEASSEPSKPGVLTRLRNRASTTPGKSKLHSVKEGTKTALAVVGAVSVVGLAAGLVAQKKSAKIEVTLPDVDVTTESAD